MTIPVDLIKKLREETGAPVIRVKQVLDEVGGSEKKAFEILQKEGFEKAAKRADRVTSQGVIASYVHHTKKIASLVELLCETDFVARNEVFLATAQDFAMQVASTNPKDEAALLADEFIKDPSMKVEDLLKSAIAKTGENIRLGRFYRLEIGA